MTAQTYRTPQALAWLRDGLCPECGSRAIDHTDSAAFWVPRANNCSLMPRGVVERLDWQRSLDAEADR